METQNKQIEVKLLLNRIQYDVTDDLAWITAFLKPRLIDITFDIQTTDLSGYATMQVQNSMGNMQYTMNPDTVNPLVTPFLSPTDEICVLVIEGTKEFGAQAPSECEEKQYITGTNTLLCVANADDVFYDQVPNFRIWLMHELYHAFASMSNYAGFPVADCMDVLITPLGKELFYYLNETPENVNSNFTILMERLNPWLISQKKT